MTAKLLSFTQSRGGWGNVELAQFARIQRLLENVGLHIDIEHGVTDEGDPWCVFCSNGTGEVVIHAACIDGRYMFDSPVLRNPIEGRSFQHCAEKFLDEAMQAIPVVRRRSTLQVHPSALLASVFLTIVLHAQATSEHNLFRSGEGSPLFDLDADASGKHASGWIKLIAQHLAELFGPHDNSNAPHNQQVLSWVTVIPAGLTVSVLGIVHELVTRDDRLLLAFDDAIITTTTSSEHADHDLVAVAAAPEAQTLVEGSIAPEEVVTAAVTVEDDAGDDKLEAKVAELQVNDTAPVILEQDLPSAYLALAHNFAEEVIAFVADAASALAGASMTMTAQAEETDNAGGIEVTPAEAQTGATTVNSIAIATVALLKPFIEASDTIEFISMPADTDIGVLLAAYGDNSGSDPNVIFGDASTSGPAIETPPPAVMADAPATPTPVAVVDVIAQLELLLDVADNVIAQRSGSGNFIFFDLDARYIDQSERIVETFVMDDQSQITFVGVAADFDGLLLA
jgi:hypothetical protein